ncbi:MAG: hypothetical protein M3Q45_06325 [Chloroflexota bacterium]|nr:hypothetical protein [Chloroflexota bacterium]
MLANLAQIGRSPLTDAALATVRESLEPAVFAEAFTAGQQMSLAKAFATILASPPLLGPFAWSADAAIV